MELKLKNLVELNTLQEDITDRILSVIEDSNTEWEYHSVSRNGASYDEDCEYFTTPFSEGYIVIYGNHVYYALLREAYTWLELSNQAVFLGDYDIVSEVFIKLEDMHYRMKILNA